MEKSKQYIYKCQTLIKWSWNIKFVNFVSILGNIFEIIHSVFKEIKTLVTRVKNEKSIARVCLVLRSITMNNTYILPLFAILIIANGINGTPVEKSTLQLGKGFDESNFLSVFSSQDLSRQVFAQDW